MFVGCDRVQKREYQIKLLCAFVKLSAFHNRNTRFNCHTLLHTLEPFSALNKYWRTSLAWYHIRPLSASNL